uniref:Gfo/Idh/MocA-like oxidoreductase N-terminal domain-containing protein n=1 Tax=Bionectria ochroleuca TaxID=29856 RepID=A0A8H7NCQ0_BIOOC
MAPIGVAIIGSGIFVKEEHLPALFKCADLSLKAIFSRSLSSAQKTAELVPEGQPKPQLYAADAGSGREYQDLLSQQDIQAVIIALPILTQPEYIKAALAAGKHVLAEKPIAADVAGARDLIDYYTKVAPEKNVTLSIAENVRFKPALSYANEQARQLGRATHFSIRVFSHMKTDSMWYNTEWRKTPDTRAASSWTGACTMRPRRGSSCLGTPTGQTRCGHSPTWCRATCPHRHGQCHYPDKVRGKWYLPAVGGDAPLGI